LRVSREIERANKDAFDIEQSKIKLLLLGAGESGKSTIFKQMKILYGIGFGEAEMRAMTPVIYNNTIVGMRTIVEACTTLAIDIVANDTAVEFMEKVSTEAVVDDYVGGLIKTLWTDAGILEAYERRAEYQLFDSAKYFFKNVDRISGEDFMCTIDDILKSRVRTSGIVEEKYVIDGVPFEMFDVGGQRNERKKWIHCFAEVTAIIFVAAISEYDQVLYEDMSQNRMVEAVELFDEICNLEWFKETAMLLFLNKKDLFEMKIKKKDIRMEIPGKPGEFLFEDYFHGLCTCGGGYPKEDEPCSCGVQDEGKQYLQEKFMEVNRNPEKTVYPHVTCATDTSNVGHVFNACKDIILNNNLKGSGFV
jgi:GTPase SAR1 family protein